MFGVGYKMLPSPMSLVKASGGMTPSSGVAPALRLDFGESDDSTADLHDDEEQHHVNQQIDSLDTLGLTPHQKHACVVLNLHFNRLGPEVMGLDGFANLRELNLSSNNVSSMEGFSCLSSLRVLNLSSNKIEQVCGLQSLSQLEELILSYNRIYSLNGLNKADFQPHGSVLRRLELQGNRLSELTELLCLVGCDALVDLKMHVDDQHSNPMCRSDYGDYYSAAWGCCRALARLDGKPKDSSLIQPSLRLDLLSSSSSSSSSSTSSSSALVQPQSLAELDAKLVANAEALGGILPAQHMGDASRSGTLKQNGGSASKLEEAYERFKSRQQRGSELYDSSETDSETSRIDELLTQMTNLETENAQLRAQIDAHKSTERHQHTHVVVCPSCDDCVVNPGTDSDCKSDTDTAVELVAWIEHKTILSGITDSMRDVLVSALRHNLAKMGSGSSESAYLTSPERKFQQAAEELEAQLTCEKQQFRTLHEKLLSEEEKRDVMQEEMEALKELVQEKDRVIAQHLQSIDNLSQKNVLLSANMEQTREEASSLRVHVAELTKIIEKTDAMQPTQIRLEFDGRIQELEKELRSTGAALSEKTAGVTVLQKHCEAITTERDSLRQKADDLYKRCVEKDREIATWRQSADAATTDGTRSRMEAEVELKFTRQSLESKKTELAAAEHDKGQMQMERNKAISKLAELKSAFAEKAKDCSGLKQLLKASITRFRVLNEKHKLATIKIHKLIEEKQKFVKLHKEQQADLEATRGRSVYVQDNLQHLQQKIEELEQALGTEVAKRQHLLAKYDAVKQDLKSLRQDLNTADEQLVKAQDTIKIRQAMNADQKESILQLKEKLAEAESANADWVKREEDLLGQLDEYMERSDKYKEREAEAKDECARLAERVEQKDGIAQEEREQFEAKLRQQADKLRMQVDAIAYVEKEVESMQSEFAKKEAVWREKIRVAQEDHKRGQEELEANAAEKLAAVEKKLADTELAVQEKSDACEAMRAQVLQTEDEMRTLLAEMKRRQEMATKFASLWQV